MPMLSLLFLSFKVDKTNNSLFSPGNLYWEELYNAIDNPYVILTVRDDEHVWLNSWKNFARVFYNNGGVFSRRIMTFIMQSGMCGYRNRRFVSLGKSNSFKSVIRFEQTPLLHLKLRTIFIIYSVHHSHQLTNCQHRFHRSR